MCVQAVKIRYGLRAEGKIPDPIRRLGGRQKRKKTYKSRRFVANTGGRTRTCNLLTRSVFGIRLVLPESTFLAQEGSLNAKQSGSTSGTARSESSATSIRQTFAHALESSLATREPRPFQSHSLVDLGSDHGRLLFHELRLPISCGRVECIRHPSCLPRTIRG